MLKVNNNKMEKRIIQKISNHNKKFKDDMKTHILDVFDEELKSDNFDTQKIQNIIKYIYEYQNLELTQQDFQKRKRVKNTVPFHSRCIALRANGDQCTRRRKGELNYCGTHSKGTPHGEINSKQPVKTHEIKHVIAQEIQGIICYIDNDNNVYDPTDIHQNKKEPRIVSKYIVENGEYKISK